MINRAIQMSSKTPRITTIIVATSRQQHADINDAFN